MSGANNLLPGRESQGHFLLRNTIFCPMNHCLQCLVMSNHLTSHLSKISNGPVKNQSRPRELLVIKYTFLGCLCPLLSKKTLSRTGLFSEALPLAHSTPYSYELMGDKLGRNESLITCFVFALQVETQVLMCCSEKAAIFLYFLSSGFRRKPNQG